MSNEDTEQRDEPARQVHIDDLTFQAGRLCLDYANTMEWHVSDQPVEYLNQYADVVAWSKRKDVITEQEAVELLRMSAQRPDEAAVVLETAIALRETIFRIFVAAFAEEAPAIEDMQRFNAAVGDALAHLTVEPTADGFAWQWADRAERLDWILWPVVRSAAELLTSDELTRVKMCEDDRGCGVLFLDTSRNQSRRWCSMESCGNRAKVRRYRAQQAQKAD